MGAGFCVIEADDTLALRSAVPSERASGSSWFTLLNRCRTALGDALFAQITKRRDLSRSRQLSAETISDREGEA